MNLKGTVLLAPHFTLCFNPHIIFDCLQASWIGSLMPLSALFGGMAGGPLIESLGRRTTILSTGLPFVLCKYI